MNPLLKRSAAATLTVICSTARLPLSCHHPPAQTPAASAPTKAEEREAKRVRDYLIAQGIAENRIDAYGLGDSAQPTIDLGGWPGAVLFMVSRGQENGGFYAWSSTAGL